MITARYSFQRNKNTVAGFASQNRASTDALNALSKWSNSNPQRSYKVIVDEDEKILAELTWQKSDSLAGVDLENLADSSGVERLYIPQ